MANSMTGFGMATFQSDKYNFTIEVKSVNNRHLDLNIRIPRNLIQLEDKVRKILFERLNRGKVDVFINEDKTKNKEGNVVVNESLAKNYIDSLKFLCDKFHLKDDITTSLVAGFPEVVKLEYEEDDIESIWQVIKEVLNDAVTKLIDMRKVEGGKLLKDIREKISFIEKQVALVENHSKDTSKVYKYKLQERINELMGDTIDLSEERLIQEVAIFADKCCIDEEIVRLKSHIDVMRETLSINEAIGRKLDFIIQEMNREVNTIGSKANNLDITTIVITLKNEIEKIREQCQNIE